MYSDEIPLSDCEQRSVTTNGVTVTDEAKTAAPVAMDFTTGCMGHLVNVNLGSWSQATEPDLITTDCVAGALSAATGYGTTVHWSTELFQDKTFLDGGTAASRGGTARTLASFYQCRVI